MYNEILSNTIGYLWTLIPFLIILISYILKNKKWYVKYFTLATSYFILEFIIVVLTRQIESNTKIESINLFTSIFHEFNPIFVIMIILYLIVKDIFKKVNSKVEKIVEDRIIK